MGSKKKVLFVFGTRPEAIKLAPVIKNLRSQTDEFSVSVCVTAQHREMLDQVLEIFEIDVDYDLDIMKVNQDLFQLSGEILKSMKGVLTEVRPDIMIVQGDTSTAFLSALAGYYLEIPVAHIEAGLRTHDKYNPFPEELNRQLLSVIADLHFAPTTEARDNLLREGIPGDRIFVTGNTIIDALLLISNKLDESREAFLRQFFEDSYQLSIDPENKKLFIVTAHRREHFGEALEQICLAVKEIAGLSENIQIVFPVHPNPNVKEKVHGILTGIKNVFLIDPLEYEPFVFLMLHAYLILTDSGGIQEEAPALGKPVILMRENTERPEGVTHGVVKMAGIKKESIVNETKNLLFNKESYEMMARKSQLYGDGTAGRKICEILKRSLKSHG